MQAEQRITGANWTMVMALGLIWGSTFMVTELALDGITPFWLAAGRITFAAVLTVLVWGTLGWPLFRSPQKPWRTLAIMGALGSAVPFALLCWGQQFVTSAYAGVSMASVSLMVLPLAHVFVPGEQMGPRRAIGFLIGFVGVVVLLGPQVFSSTGAAFETAGRLACLGAAACYATGSILMRRLPAIDPIGLAAVPLLFGTAISVPLAWAVEGPPPLPDARTLAVIAFLGLIPTAAANFLRVTVIRTAGPVFMSLVGYQVPLWSVVLGIVLLDEPWQATLFLALVLIVGGLVISQWRALRTLVRRLRRTPG